MKSITTMAPSERSSKKERIVEEIKNLFQIILYLAVCLSLLATFRALVLIQVGIDEFAGLYITAIVEAIILGKVVAIAQLLPIMNAYDQRPLVWAALYKAIIMTVIVYAANMAEEAIFHHTKTPLHPLILMFAHVSLLMLMFIALFTIKGLDKKLGHGQLLKLIFN